MLESTRDDVNTGDADAVRDAWERYRQQARTAGEPIARQVYGVCRSDASVTPGGETSAAEQLLELIGIADREKAGDQRNSRNDRDKNGSQFMLCQDDHPLRTYTLR